MDEPALGSSGKEAASHEGFKWVDTLRGSADNPKGRLAGRGVCACESRGCGAGKSRAREDRALCVQSSLQCCDSLRYEVINFKQVYE